MKVQRAKQILEHIILLWADSLAWQNVRQDVGMDPELPGGHQQGQGEGEAGQQGERGVEYCQHLQIHADYE